MSGPTEAARLQALAGYHVLDTLPEEAFDRLTALAADLFDAPIALVSLLDAERQWFKSRKGLEIQSTPRSWAFCHHAIAQGSRTTLVVEDAAADPRFENNPLVTSAPNIRFYAGAVLTDRDGFNLGTLCVIDTHARPAPSERDLRRLQVLARIVVDELELRRTTRLARDQGDRLKVAESVAGVGSWRLDSRTRQIAWSDQMYTIYALPHGAPLSLPMLMAMTHSENSDEQTARAEAQFETGIRAPHAITRITAGNGETRYLATNSTVERDATGKAVAIIGTVLDVTRQKTIELALTAERELLQVTLHSIADGVVSTNENGDIRYINPAAERMLGMSSAAARGLPFQQAVRLLDQKTGLQIENPIDHAIANASSTDVTHEAILQVASDPVDRPIQYSVSLILGRHGQYLGAVMVLQDLSEVRILAQRMSHLAQHDPLTNLPNRILLHDRVRQAVQAGQRNRQSFGIAYLDLDGFKQVNDNLGHLAGDELLKIVAERLQAALRASDTICRLGGDEFAILLAGLESAEAAAEVAADLVSKVAQPCRLGEEGAEVIVSVSLGLAMFPHDGEDAETLMRNADSAMYRAKNMGKNRYQLFSQKAGKRRPVAVPRSEAS